MQNNTDFPCQKLHVWTKWVCSF